VELSGEVGEGEGETRKHTWSQETWANLYRGLIFILHYEGLARPLQRLDL